MGTLSANRVETFPCQGLILRARMVSSWLGREALLYLATPPRHDEDTPRSKGHERFMFTGHKGDGESGLYYAPERYYSPFQARWTTRDPLGMVDGPNVYAYVRGNVIILVDPYGPYFWHWDRELDGNPRDYLFEGGAAAFDGFFPFGNPLQDVYANPDGSIPVAHRWSRVLGAVSPMIGGAGSYCLGRQESWSGRRSSRAFWAPLRRGVVGATRGDSAPEYCV